MRYSVRLSQMLLASISILMLGCAREGPFSHDQKLAVRQVDKLIPRGTSETRAKKALSDRGFQLSRLNPDQAANHLLLGTYTKGETTWQVGLVIVEAKVAGSSVAILDASALPK
jgi:hypothetical protein